MDLKAQIRQIPDFPKPGILFYDISTLLQREYVTLDKKRFRPTDVGRVVGKFLANHFTQYVDYDFTAKLEDELDAVSRGEEEWVPLLRRFWGPFKERVDDKEQSVSRSEVTTETLDEPCPKCGWPILTIKTTKRRGTEKVCPQKDCDFAEPVEESEEESYQTAASSRPV